MPPLERALAEAFSLLNPALEAAGFPPKPLPLKESVELSERMRVLAAESGDQEAFWSQTSDTLAFLDPPTYWQPLDKFTGEERLRALVHAALDLIHTAALEVPLTAERFGALVSEVELLCLDTDDDDEADEIRSAVADRLARLKPPAAASRRRAKKPDPVVDPRERFRGGDDDFDFDGETRPKEGEEDKPKAGVGGPPSGAA